MGALGTLTQLFSSAPPGIYKGHCFRINHFPEDNDYDHDSSEYLLRECQDPASPCLWDGGREAGRRWRKDRPREGRGAGLWVLPTLPSDSGY